MTKLWRNDFAKSPKHSGTLIKMVTILSLFSSRKIYNVENSAHKSDRFLGYLE
jgi:hypothetical protein